MRVLVAPDKFAGTLTAPEAAAAIAEGWSRSAPDDVIDCLPMSDGGPGFVEVLQRCLGGRLDPVMISGPQGQPTPATVLRIGAAAYLETAQACGRQAGEAADPWTASTSGVGELIAAAVDAGARTVVVGLGGSVTNDGGAGLLGALGGVADVPLDGGPRGLSGISSADLSAARARLHGVNLIAAADVDVPLLGMFGATRTFGPQKGLTDADVLTVDRVLDEFVVATCGSEPAERRIAESAGAGAAGGLGFGLLLLGAQIRRGVDLVSDSLGLADACERSDLVVSGEGTFDHTSRSGKVVHGVAQRAGAGARPCVILAGQVTVGSREIRAMGVDAAYAMDDVVGLEVALSQPAESLSRLAERAARTWSRR